MVVIYCVRSIGHISQIAYLNHTALKTPIETAVEFIYSRSTINEMGKVQGPHLQT